MKILRNGEWILTTAVIIVACSLVKDVSGIPKLKKLHRLKPRPHEEEQTGKKRDVNSGAGSNAGTNADTNANTGAATASQTGTESQTYTNTKVNTRIATSSNARSGANAAAKVKTYAHANTETKVNTHQQSPTQTPPTSPGTGSPSRPRLGPPPPGGPTATPKPNVPVIKVYCPKCPCPCQPPCPCICPCLVPVPCAPPCHPPRPPPPPPPPPPPCWYPCCDCCPPPPMPCYSCPCRSSIANETVANERPKRPKLKRHSSYKVHRSVEDGDELLAKRHRNAGKKDHSAEISKARAARFKKCAVAADNIKCSTIGKNIFKKGGGAVDAIIATHACVEVVNLHSTGLGGGGFMLVYDKKSGRSSAFDFRETLPLKYVDTTNKTQGETILVPGVPRGLEAAHKKYGKLPWSTLFEPAIKLAERGFRIHEALAAAIKKKEEYIMSNLGLRELFAPQGELLKLGDVLKRPKLARTYRMLAKSGSADIFYTGEIGRQIIEDIKEAGGVMTREDLANYRAVERGPLRTKVNNLIMLSTPPPGSGALISLALKIMDGLKLTPDDLLKHPALTYHKMIEALKFAYAPFTFLGDPRFTNHTEEVIKYMLDDKVADSMRARIDKVSHTVDYYQPYSKLSIEEANGTSHMSALGPDGDAVSLTSSINAYFGSKLLSRELGFIYNNELADFSEFWPSVYNLTKDRKEPGKRPMSKSSPIIFLDPESKKVQGVFGAAGGFFIPSCLSMTIANWLFFKDDLKVAVSRPRLHCQLFPPTVVYEPTFPAELVPQLESYSHAYVTNSTYDVSGQMHAIMGVVQAIVREPDGTLAAESDYRKGGVPDGY